MPNQTMASKLRSLALVFEEADVAGFRPIIPASHLMYISVAFEGTYWVGTFDYPVDAPEARGERAFTLYMAATILDDMCFFVGQR